ncbi:MAG TPA: TetR/AcrR family transcriptional regulator [Solirubrobacteraceae bacterium]|jgi:AcrR family transcriptional regulator
MAAERTRASMRRRAGNAAERQQRGPRVRNEEARLGHGIANLQRSRLLSAAVGLLAEHGYGSFSVAALCERTGVSRRTFYEVFEDREACFVALLDEVEERGASLISGMGVEGAWSERVRMGLWATLCLADSDPALAKVCLIESQRADGPIQERRERIVRQFVEAIDEGRSQSTQASAASELTAEALIGAISAVMSARLTGAVHGAATAAGVDMRSLLGELMAMIVLPYQGPAAARRELGRARPATLVEAAETEMPAGTPDPLAGRPARLTYRTARVLQAVAALCADGEGVSNRQVAEHAAIGDPGQASKLLARLQAHDLLENVAKGNLERGEANQWRLTSAGRQLVRSITAQAGERQMRGRSAA